jgi:hypothetical protein
MASAANKEVIQQFYIAYYGRPGDPAGIDYWADRLEAAGGVLTAVLDAFGNSDEANTQFGAGRDNATRAQIEASITDIYEQTFGRTPDAAGLDFYADGVEAGTFTLIDVAKRIVDGKTGDDVTILANKVTAANAYSDALRADATANANYDGDAAADVGRGWLATVLKDAATLTAAQDDLADTIDSLAPVAFTLTTGVDKFTGGPVNDTYTGVTSALTSLRTFQNTDVLDGGAGTDTATLTLEADFGGFITGVGSMKNIEVLNLNNTTSTGGTAADRTFDASGVSGVETINVGMNAKSFTIDNLDVTDLAVAVSGSTAAGTLTINVADTDVAGELSLTLNTAKSLTVAADGFTSLNVVSNGTNAASLATGTSESITITGAGALTVSAVDAEVTSVDASAATGAQTLTLTAATGLETVSTGSGADKVTILSAAAVESVSTGAGNDTLTIRTIDVEATLDGSTGTDELVFDTLSGTVQPTITGFETLTFKTNSADVTLSAAGVSGVSTLKIADDITTGKNITIAGLANTALTVSIADAANAFGTGTGGLIYTGAAALTVNATSTHTSAVTLNTDITAANATSLSLSAGKYATVAGDFSAAKAAATSLTVAEGGSFTGTLTAAAATSATLNVSGTSSGSVTVAKANTVDVTLGSKSTFTSAISAATATTVTVDSADTDAIALKIGAAKATNLSISTASAVTFVGADTDLSSVQNVTLSGTGSVDTSAAGAAGADFGDTSSSVSVDASALKGALIVDIGDYEAGEGSVTVIGSELGANTVTIRGGRNEVEVTGGISNDSVTISEALTGEGSYSFDLGSTSTADTVTFTGTSDLSSASVSFAGVDVVNTATKLTLKSAAVTGQTIEFDGTALVVAGSTSADSIDLSALVSTGDATITVNAGSGADTVLGADKASTLNGDAGNDSMVGGDGNDTITGGVGADTMTGGSGNDVFIMYADSSSAVSDGRGDALTKDAVISVVNAANADVITDFAGSDILTFDTVNLVLHATDFGTLGTPTDNKISLALGTYDSTTKIFTYNASATTATAGYATLVIYDTNPLTTAQSFKAVVLVGHITPNTDNDVDSSGGYTGLVGTGG